MPYDENNPTKNKSAYFNRELSWLAFNRRVLEQAYDERFPILDRMRFLSFVASNLDEFYEIRVAGLIQQVESNVVETGPDGLGPKEQIRRVHSISASLVHDQYECWHKQIVPVLAENGVFFKTREQFTKREISWLEKYFDEEVYPVLTPLASDPAHPFPSFGNKTLNLLLWLDDPETPETETILAFIPVPRILPRVVCIPGTERAKPAYVFLSDVIKTFADRLFTGYKIKAVHAFRITRNSDLYIDEEEVENLLLSIEEELYKRRKGSPVRLEIEDGVNDELLERLLTNIGLSRQHVFNINGPINMMRLQSVYDLIDRPDLKSASFTPHVPHYFSGEYNIYDVIREQDRLLHHPYDSFSPVVDFVAQAAQDPKVLAIKMTLYRTSSDSPIVKALMAAARNGKQVTALIELKARFDEANNINWARLLEEAGVHVVYGFVKLKTHCKCCLVVRREESGIRRYAHLGTGNYHSKTAKLYTDLSFFTCREDITEEVAAVFNTLTGFAKSPKFERLLVAPFNLHSKMQEFILREAKNAKAGKPARIIAKCNSLIDKDTIDALYEASRSGVQIDLIVRGICGLVPGVPGMSSTIRVRSILGRFLEHSRIFYFENAGKPEIYLGSADWMPRNFFRRVEVVFPVEQEDLRTRIVEEVLGKTLEDTTAKILKPNGAYGPVARADGQVFAEQDYFMSLAEKKTRSEVENSRANEKDIFGGILK
ncbi:MAG: polyphosphate kinase 1 [Opitutales bacterium]|nr:polyphosphate kinase 1 [Opitutales bacterium]